MEQQSRIAPTMCCNTPTPRQAPRPTTRRSSAMPHPQTASLSSRRPRCPACAPRASPRWQESCGRRNPTRSRCALYWFAASVLNFWHLIIGCVSLGSPPTAAVGTQQPMRAISPCGCIPALQLLVESYFRSTGAPVPARPYFLGLGRSSIGTPFTSFDGRSVPGGIRNVQD